MRRALLSVSDKEGIVEFARGLAGMGVEIVSTGGTAAALSEAGLEVRAIDDLTGFPEIMDGRVKTLNPKLYAGLLARRDDASHMEQAAGHGIEFVDLVCVNLYPFEETVARDGVDEAEVIENIDIGGPTMVRATAKNFAFSAIVTDPGQYGEVLDTLNAGDGTLSLDQLQGGTFTITNGGVYGSLMSTPILNMPQSGILGMHNIVQRPVAVDGQVVVRPMMYLALSYDHRIVDGKEAVTFLVRIKEHLEDPQRFLLDV